MTVRELLRTLNHLPDHFLDYEVWVQTPLEVYYQARAARLDEVLETLDLLTWEGESDGTNHPGRQ